MATASYMVDSFLGGELSQFAQGRASKPDYKISLNVCLNAFPVEIGPWTRRPGSMFAGTTLGGNPGRVISWSFEQSTPYTIELTNGSMRFRQGPTLVSNNDSVGVSSISTANPAVLTTPAATAWLTGTTIMLANLGTSIPLLQNRQISVTKLTTETFSLQDAITGANIDGSTLSVSGLAAGATAYSIQTLTTPYTAGIWSSLRMVQAETTGILLQGATAPQALTVTTLPAGSVGGAFALAAATFDDGPYLDPFTNGVMVTPNQTTGVVQLTLSFPAYVASTSYAKGDFVTASSVNYISIQDQNIGNTPSSSATYWTPVSAGAAINPPATQPSGLGRGFLSSDVGRLVRLFSEPPLWLVGSTYAEGAVVSYNPTEIPGAATYWQALVGSNTGNIPGSDLTNWELVAPGAALPSIGTFTNPAAASGPAQWTWGKITSLINFIPNAPSGIAQLGNMTGNGGLSAAFNGNTTQAFGSSAALLTGPGISTSNQILGYVGQNFSGCSPNAYIVQSATLFPTTDLGLAYIYARQESNFGGVINYGLTANLYGSNTAPSSAENGTLLGSTLISAGSFGPSVVISGSLGTSAVNIASNNITSTFKYVWVVLVFTASSSVPYNFSTFDVQVGQVELVTTGTGTSSNGVDVELLGPALLYTTPILTWQLGAYSGTTGFPTVGCYADGRLWLGGAIPNRFDACYSNGIVGGEVNFAPTDQYGNVTAANAISYTLNGDSINPIYWMLPDLQGILIGTQQREILLFPPSAGGFAPNNIDSRPAGRHGCANVEPRPTEHTYVFVQRFMVKLMELFADVFSGKFTAPNLADKAQHITRNGIAEIAYAYAATPIIWMRDALGNLSGCTYKRDTLMTSQGPTYYAWHRHALGSNRSIASITVGPSVGGNLDALTMVTNQANAIDPQFGVYHVEVLTDTMDELTPAASAWFLDDAVVPSSTVSSNTPATGTPYGGLTLNGLWHLNGESVAVFAGGLDCGNFTVASGSCFVPYGDSVSAGTGGGLFTAAFAASGIQIVVGFTYNSDGQLVRAIAPQDTGARNGPALGKERSNHKVAFLFNNLSMANTANQSAISFGTSFSKLSPALINLDTTKKMVWSTPLATYSGVWRDAVGDEQSFDGMICWRISRPLAGTVVAVEPMLETQDQ